MMPVAIDEVRLSWSPAAQALVPVQGQAPSRPVSPGGRFIKGPIPLDWIGQAACLPGKTLHVALTLQYLAGLNKSNTVKLSAKALGIMGVGRDAKADALGRLQEAQLIAVHQSPGRAPVVTLLGNSSHSSPKGGRHE